MKAADSTEFYKQVIINAVFWTGVFSIGLTLLKRDFSLALFLVALVAFNLVIYFTLRLFAPSMLPAASGSAQGPAGEFNSVGFILTPIKYPKILDAEMRDFAPEFIRLDIQKNGAMVFSANMARDALKGLRDALSNALEIKEVPSVQAALKPKVIVKNKKAN